MYLYNLTRFNKLSKIFQPLNVFPKNAIIKKHDVSSKSQKLMLDLGFIRHANPGCYHFLPLGLRSMEKLTNLVDFEMKNIEAQKIILPTLTNANLWKTTGRLKVGGPELFMLEDRHNKKYIISPTYEESVSELLASVSPLSYKQFPLRLYQISCKFRDEIKPRFGLIRSRQFTMKDLYTFDIDIAQAEKAYEEVSKCYDNIFNQIGLQYIKVSSLTGNIGGFLSHEYHFPAEIGEDRLLLCKKCNYAANIELCNDNKCPQCNNQDVIIKSGIEVGHTFLLLDKYSNPLNAKYLALDGKPRVLQMGSYGLGLSRILASCVEILSLENEIRWPVILAPYIVLIIPSKQGSKEEAVTSKFASTIYSNLETLTPLVDNVLIDDRTQMTIGKRLFEARRVGYPFIIVIGNSAVQNPPLFEFHDLNNNIVQHFTEQDIFYYIKQKLLS